MTDAEKELANKIYNSIQVVLTPADKVRLNLKTMDEEIAYTRQEKSRQTTERLAQRGITL